MTNPPSTPAHGRGFRLAARGLIITATAAAFVGAGSLSASAAPGDTSPASVTANVIVNSTITLAVDQPAFTLRGDPGDDALGEGAVTGTVTTNSAAGYSIGVLAAVDSLTPATAGNPDSIPIADLQVADSAATYTSLSTTDPVITTTSATRSAPSGDAFSDDYRMTVPDINSDTYSVTLDYTATALA